MDVFNRLFGTLESRDPISDGSSYRNFTAAGSSCSLALDMIDDNLQTTFGNYTPRECKLADEFLKKLSEGECTIDSPVECRRRPGEFTEVDFPKSSYLTLKEKQTYNAMLELQKENSLDAEKLETFHRLGTHVKLENVEYQEFARHEWFTKNYLRHSDIKPSVKNYIDDIWQCRIERIAKYPKYYKQQQEMIPLTYNDCIDSENPLILKMGDELFATGEHNSFVLPPIQYHPKEVTYLPTDYETLMENRNPAYEFLPPVSLDPAVENLIQENEILKNEQTIVVLSGSSLKALVDNHQTGICSNWMVPISVREYKNGAKTRKAVFIDKRLPPQTLSLSERVQWYARIACRMMMCKRPEEQSDDNLVTPMDIDSGMDDSDEREENASFPRCKVNNVPIWSAGHRTYRVWQVGKESQNQLMKNQVGQIKILLRTKYDGFWPRKKLKDQLFHVASKLDYQREYGGDSLSPSEYIRQWTDLHIRPGALLKRARIDPVTSEFMQLQTIDEAEISSELRSAHGINAQSFIANTLYSITSRLIHLKPGKYLMEHSQKSGAFCVLSTACESSTPGCFNVMNKYPSCPAESVSALSAPFIPLDGNFKNMNCLYKHVLPLTFPARLRVLPVNPVTIEKKNNSMMMKKKKKKKKSKAKAARKQRRMLQAKKLAAKPAEEN